MLAKIKKAISNPKIVLNILLGTFVGRILPDKTYLKIKYRLVLGKKLDLKNPQSFNEKLQWLKLYDRNPEYTTYVDKYAVRKYIAEKLGEEYLIPLLGVWDDPEKIDFDSLPDQFVLKCNHNSGLGMCICKDKSKLDIEKVKKELTRGLKQNYYLYGREWPYKGVPRKIICEQYIEDQNGELNDYKFFCFDGKVDCVMVVTDRTINEAKFYYMSREWKVLPYGRLTRSLPKDFTLPKPQNIEKMFEIAEKLSVGYPQVRIDLYNVDGKIYFGEYTLFSQSGFEDGFDYVSDKHLGDQVILPEKINNIK